MRYRIACVGRIKEDYFTALIDEYKKAGKKAGGFEICEVPDESIPQKSGDRINARIMAAEAERLLRVIGRDDYVIALCIDGKKTTDEALTQKLQSAKERGYTSAVFVIGGSLGLDPSVIKRADYKMSISDMTFPHQLMRVLVAEQISRLPAHL